MKNMDLFRFANIFLPQFSNSSGNGYLLINNKFFHLGYLVTKFLIYNVKN